MGTQDSSFDSALLECTLEHLPDPVFVKNREHKWIYLNQAFCAFVGFSREEMLGKTDHDFFPHDLANVFRQVDEFVFENKKTVRNVEKIIDSEGEHKVIATKKAHVVDNKGNQILIGTLRDITEVTVLRENEKQVNRVIKDLALGKSREQVLSMIRDIAEAQFPGMTASILQVDPSGKKLRMAITSRLPDYFRRAIEGTPIRDNMGSCGTAAFHKKRVVIQDIQNHPSWARVKDLTVKANLVSCWSEPVIASNGDVVGTFALYYDQSRGPDEKEIQLMGIMAQVAAIAMEHHKLNEEKASLRNLLSNIIDSMPSVMIGVDQNGDVVLWNKEAEKITGTVNAEAKGKKLAEVYPDLQPTIVQGIEQAIVTGETQPVVKNECRVAGQSIYQDFTVYPLSAGGIDGAVIRIDDTTEKVQLEEAMIHTDKMMSIGLLAGGIAHDFNNILVGILGNLSMATQYLEIDSEPYEIIEKAETASLRAKGLANQLLTFAKGGDPIRKPASITKLIEESVRFLLPGSNVQSNHFFDDDVLPVDIDTDQMGQVIQNLIINAKEAVEEGGRIDISCYNVKKGEKQLPRILAGEKYVAVEVRDYGSGISAEVMKHIFEPYFTTKKHGSGLGLAVCHSIVSKHDGFLTIRVPEGKGISFLFYLPAVETELIKEEPTSEPILSAEKKQVILIMDDDITVCEILRDMLDFLGYETVLTYSGEEALSVYSERAQSGDDGIDLVIMDLVIPSGMGGKETVGQLHDIYPNAKVIVTSGYSNDPILANHNQYGFVGALAKPFQLREVAAIVNDIFDS